MLWKACTSIPSTSTLSQGALLLGDGCITGRGGGGGRGVQCFTKVQKLIKLIFPLHKSPGPEESGEGVFQTKTKQL